MVISVTMTTTILVVLLLVFIGMCFYYRHALKRQQHYGIRLSRINEQLKHTNTRLEQMSLTDSLTGLANRRYFDLVLAQEYARHARNNGMLSLLMIDIDYFKSINDTYGHLVGDACLELLSDYLRNSVSRSGDLVARYGGEEFAIILPRTSLAGAVTIAHRISEGMQRLILPTDFIDTPPPTITVSIGVASVLCDNNSSDLQLLEKADQHLYNAKNAGRNLVWFEDQSPSLNS